MTAGEPHFEDGDLQNLGLIGAVKAFGERWAMFWFAALLDSPFARHSARCDDCKTYFAYQRARLHTVKYGVSCPKCEPIVAVRRMEHSRKKRLDTAAKASIEWNPKKHTDLRRWVADRVSQVHSTTLGRRWALRTNRRF
jgi:hypothetical protein